MKLKFIFSDNTEGWRSIRNAKAFSLKGTKDSIPGLTPTLKILFTKTKPYNFGGFFLQPVKRFQYRLQKSASTMNNPIPYEYVWNNVGLIIWS